MDLQIPGDVYFLISNQGPEFVNKAGVAESITGESRRSNLNTETSSQKQNVTALIGRVDDMNQALDQMPLRSDDTMSRVSGAGSVFKKRTLSIVPKRVEMTPRRKSPTRSVAGDFDHISKTEARGRLNRDNLDSLNGDSIRKPEPISLPSIQRDKPSFTHEILS